MAEFKKRENYTTPVGVAVYPHLHVPDTKFDDNGVYSTKVRFIEEAAAKLVELLDREYALSREEAIAEVMEKKNITKKLATAKIKRGPDPYEVELDEDGEETGAIIVNFKMKASGIRKKDQKKWTRKPTIFDGSGNPVAVGLKIGSGSELKIATDINRYYMPAIGAGVSLRLNAVQVISLQTWGDGISAEAAGFDAVEGGFEASEASVDNFASQNDQPEATPEATPRVSDPDPEAGDDEEDDGDY